MSESGGWCGIGQIISWHVHSLHRSNRSFLSSSNSLLQSSQISSQSGLVPHSRRNSSQKSRNLRTGLSESKDIIDKEQNVSIFLVSEILGDCKPSQTDSGSGTRWLVHLSVYESCSAFFVEIDDSEGLHFFVQIVTFSGSLSDPCENRISSVGCGDVVNQFHDKDCFSDSGSSEKTNFSSSGIWGQEVDHFNTSDQKLLFRGLLGKTGSVSVNGVVGLCVDWSSFVDWLSNDI